MAAQEKMVEFVHIPKCGGWTIHQYFIDLFTLERTVDFTYAKDPAEVSLDNVRMVLGHRDVDAFDALKAHHGYSSYRFAFVRQPAERMWSYYRYLSRTKRLPSYDWIIQATFREFLERVQARTLTSGGQHEASQVTYLTGFQNPSEDQIREAVEARLDGVFRLEDIAVALPHISRTLDLPIPEIQQLNADEKRSNGYSKSAEMTDDDVAFIKEHYQTDQFLFDLIPAL